MILTKYHMILMICSNSWMITSDFQMILGNSWVILSDSWWSLLILSDSGKIHADSQ